MDSRKILDQLDEENRMKDLSDFLDDLPDDVFDENARSKVKQILEDREEEASQVERGDSAQEHLQSYKGPDDIYSLSLLRNDDGETVRRLVNEIHEQQVLLTTQELHLNHYKLQVEALLLNEQKHRMELDEARFSLATAEQDKLLLEVALNYL